MHRHRLFTFGLVLAALVVVVSGCQSPEDRWSEMQQEIAGAEVVSVALRGPRTANSVITGAECQEFVRALIAGTFDEDNPNDYGPTPEVSALFTCADGQAIVANEWPDGRFELRYKDRQFLVRAPKLELLLESRGFDYE
jgi:hypothetical protein